VVEDLRWQLDANRTLGVMGNECCNGQAAKVRLPENPSR
jgi:hypothetical protein